MHWRWETLTYFTLSLVGALIVGAFDGFSVWSFVVAWFSLVVGALLIYTLFMEL